jgi:hypothetical protein
VTFLGSNNDQVGFCREMGEDSNDLHSNVLIGCSEWNPVGLIRPSRGIRQRDPYLPTFSSFAQELLALFSKGLRGEESSHGC